MKPLLPASLSLSSLALTLGITATAATPKAPLNVLLFTADDMAWFSVATFGSPVHVPNVTPNLDRFATQSLSFTRAHVNFAICQPSRGILGTGQYAHISGIEGFYHAPHPVTTVMGEFRAHGYLTGILGKVAHSTPDAAYRWDFVHDQNELGHGRNPKIYAAYFHEFLRDCKKKNKPFYFMCNSHDPHHPWVGEPADLKMRDKTYAMPSHIFTPAEVIVPKFLPDLPKVREDIARYCSSARRCDDTFGAIMKVLDDEGLADNTIVVFLSDNGISTPFAKANNYYNSTRTPLMIRWPGKTKPGTKNETDFVSGIDYMPTVLEACGFTPPKTVNGRSYVPLLLGEKQENRDKVFTQIYENHEKKRYPMFAVEDAHYRLIYNPWSDGKYAFHAEPMAGLTWKTMVAASATDPRIRARVEDMKYRTPLELYDIEKDPDALHNLAKDPKYADALNHLREELLDWMKQYDQGILPVFANFPDEQKRAAYMTAQKQLVQSHKQGKKSAKSAAPSDEGDD